MTIPIIPTAAGIALLAVSIYRLIIFPLVVSPLAKLPNAHWSVPLSSFWILFHRQQQNDTPTVHNAHIHLGPIVRLAPNEISVNCVDGGIRTIYAGGFEKSYFYDIFQNYQVRPMFAMEESSLHSKRKRMLSNIYAKSTLHSSAALTKIKNVLIHDKFIPRLREDAETGKPIEFYDVLSAAVMDFVANYVFGLKNGSDFLTKRAEGIKFFHDFKNRQKYAFWGQEMPQLTNWAQRLHLKWLLVPGWVDNSNFDIETWIMSMCDGAEKTLRSFEASQAEQEGLRMEDYPSVYAQLRNALLKASSKSSTECSIDIAISNNRLEVASELLDHVLAGFDTSGITLTWLAWQLSQPHNTHWQKALREELAPLNGEQDARTIDNLPILHAILMESLRLHAAIPGNQPRVTPKGALTTLGDAEHNVLYHNLPPNIRVQAQAYSLHRNPDVFPDPETWNPARWINVTPEQARAQARWFWAFGSGGRMCVGSNLAMLDMKAVIAGVWGHFTTEIADDEGMIPNGGYLAEPIGVGPGGKKGVGEGRKYLLLNVKPLET